MINQLKLLRNHSGFKKYLLNIGWLLGEKVVRMGISLWIGIWITRYLGTEEFGLFNYAISFVSIFTVFSTLGLDQIVIRELLKDESKKDLILGTAFVVKLAGACFTWILLGISTLFTSNDALTNTLILIIASATLFSSLNVVDFYFQSKVLSVRRQRIPDFEGTDLREAFSSSGSLSCSLLLVV
jgi:O-antigen/teichoic acid export membrane protein